MAIYQWKIEKSELKRTQRIDEVEGRWWWGGGENGAKGVIVGVSQCHQKRSSERKVTVPSGGFVGILGRNYA